MLYDELSVYRGNDFVVSPYMTIHQVTIGEIEEYGERQYYNMIYNLTATPQSMKWQLWDMGIDYTKITAFDLFCSLIVNLYGQDKTKIIFGDLDLTKFQVGTKDEDNSLVLFQYINGNRIEFDECTYMIMTDYLRSAHGITKDERIPANESTKMILIEDARDEYNQNVNKPYSSQLKNLVSAMINSEGFKYNHEQVWNMKINAFMDSVKRISKIKNADVLLQSGYSGFGINLKEVDHKQLNWLGELN